MQNAKKAVVLRLEFNKALILKKLTKTINAVIFDCDGVLVDSEIVSSQISLIMLRPYGIEMSLMDYARLFSGKVEEDIMGIIQQEYNVSLPEDFTAKLRLRIEYKLDNELQSIQGAKDTISNIKKPVAVASNSRLVRVIHSLKVAGLSSLFDKRLYAAEMVKRPKPYPDVYLHAAEQLNVNPAECLVVEDSISGVTAAYSAGMNVIGFLGASHIYEGHGVKLMDAGAFATAKDMQSLNLMIQEIMN